MSWILSTPGYSGKTTLSKKITVSTLPARILRSVLLPPKAGDMGIRLSHSSFDNSGVLCSVGDNRVYCFTSENFNEVSIDNVFDLILNTLKATELTSSEVLTELSNDSNSYFTKIGDSYYGAGFREILTQVLAPAAKEEKERWFKFKKGGISLIFNVVTHDEIPVIDKGFFNINELTLSAVVSENDFFSDFSAIALEGFTEVPTNWIQPTRSYASEQFNFNKQALSFVKATFKSQSDKRFGDLSALIISLIKSLSKEKSVSEGDLDIAKICEKISTSQTDFISQLGLSFDDLVSEDSDETTKRLSLITILSHILIGLRASVNASGLVRKQLFTGSWSVISPLDLILVQQFQRFLIVDSFIPVISSNIANGGVRSGGLSNDVIANLSSSIYSNVLGFYAPDGAKDPIQTRDLTAWLSGLSLVDSNVGEDSIEHIDIPLQLTSRFSNRRILHTVAKYINELDCEGQLVSNADHSALDRRFVLLITPPTRVDKTSGDMRIAYVKDLESNDVICRAELSTQNDFAFDDTTWVELTRGFTDKGEKLTSPAMIKAENLQKGVQNLIHNAINSALC